MDDQDQAVTVPPQTPGREDREIIEALQAFKKEFIRHTMEIPPRVAMFYPTVIESLEELLTLRAFIKHGLQAEAESEGDEES